MSPNIYMASNVKWQYLFYARKNILSFCWFRHQVSGLVLQAVFNTGLAVHLTAPNIYKGSAFQPFSNDKPLKWPRLCRAAIENIAYPFAGQSSSRLGTGSAIQLSLGEGAALPAIPGNSSTSIASNIILRSGCGVQSSGASYRELFWPIQSSNDLRCPHSGSNWKLRLYSHSSGLVIRRAHRHPSH